MEHESNVAQEPLIRHESLVFERIARWFLIAIFFLLPLWILPLTILPLELNKAFLVTVFAIASLVFYAVAAVRKGYIEIPRHPILIGAVALVAVFFVSYVFSVSKNMSFFGSGAEPLTLFNIIIASLIIFLMLSLFRDQHQLPKPFFAFLLSAVIIIILELFHAVFSIRVFPWDFAADKGFNTVGSWNALGVFFAAVMLFFIPLVVLIHRRLVSLLVMFAWALALLIVLLINFSIVWKLLGLFALFFLSFHIAYRKFDAKAVFMIVALLLFSLLFIIGRGQIGGLLPQVSQTIEVSPNLPATFTVVKNVLFSRPIVGLGPNTFGFAWDRWRPNQLNNTAFWSTRFVNSQSLAGNLVADVGLLGVFGFLLFSLFFIMLLVRSFVPKHNEPLYSIGISCGAVALLLFVSFFVYAYNYTLFMLLFLFIGLLAALNAHVENTSVKRFEIVSKTQRGSLLIGFILVTTFGISAAALYAVSVRYAGAIYFARGLQSFNSGLIDEAEERLVRAANFDSTQSRYVRALSQIEFARLQNLIATANQLSPQDAQSRFQQHLSSAISLGQRAVNLDAQDVNNWRILGQIYETVIPFVGGSGNFAFTMYSEAGKRAPNNPLFFVDRARARIATAAQFEAQGGKDGASLASQEYEEAQKELQGAISLKPDFASAYFLMAQIEARHGNTSGAIERTRQAAISSPNDVGVLFQLGLLYYQDKQFSNARVVFERAVSINPNYSNALYFLGLTYDKQGEENGAIQAFEKIVVLNPDNQEAQNILSNLRAGKSALSGIVPPAPSPEKRIAPPVEQGKSRGE